MSYEYHEEWDAPSYTPGPTVKTSITIHWWGQPIGQTFQGTVDWFRSGPGTSAHYVASAGQVACLVSPSDIAWHAGNWNGNLTSIGIECNPRGSDADYATVAELVRNLRAMYGDLPLRPHKYWTSTECPGTYDLARIDRLARGVPAPPKPAKPKPTPAPKPKPKPTPKPTPAPTPIKEDEVNPVYIRTNPQASVYALNTVTGKKRIIPREEWSGLRAAWAASGQPMPLGQVTEAELKAIPNG